jgi:hypothetical protein
MRLLMLSIKPPEILKSSSQARKNKALRGWLSGPTGAAAWVKRLPIDPRNRKNHDKRVKKSPAVNGNDLTLPCTKAPHYNQRSVFGGTAPEVVGRGFAGSGGKIC